LKCYTFLWVKRQHNCSPAASFCKLLYDTIPVKSASANVSLYTSNSKNAKFWVMTLLSQVRDMWDTGLQAENNSEIDDVAIRKLDFTVDDCTEYEVTLLQTSPFTYAFIVCTAYEECVKMSTGKLIYLKISWHQIRSTNFLE
jgi:hypothetical protein